MDSELSHTAGVPNNLAIANNYSEIAENYKESAEWDKAIDYLMKSSQHFRLAAEDVDNPSTKSALLLLAENHARRHQELAEFNEALKRKIEQEEEEENYHSQQQQQFSPSFHIPQPSLEVSSDSTRNEDLKDPRGASPFYEIEDQKEQQNSLVEKWYELIDGVCQVVDQITEDLSFRHKDTEESEDLKPSSQATTYNLTNSEESFFVVTDDVPPPLPPRTSSLSGWFPSLKGSTEGKINTKEIQSENEQLKKQIKELTEQNNLLLKNTKRIKELEEENSRYKLALIKLKNHFMDVKNQSSDLSFSQGIMSCNDSLLNKSILREKPQYYNPSGASSKDSK